MTAASQLDHLAYRARLVPSLLTTRTVFLLARRTPSRHRAPPRRGLPGPATSPTPPAKLSLTHTAIGP